MFKHLNMTMITLMIFIFAGASTGYSYTATYTQTVENPSAENQDGTAITYDVWLDNNKMRMDADANGEKRSMLIREDGIFTYMPARNLYIKSPAVPKWPAGLRNPVDYVLWVKNQQKETLPGEMLNGYQCDVYRYRDEASGSIVTVWVWQGQDFPIKIAFAGGLIESLVTFRNVTMNEPIPPETFEVPKGAKEFNPNSLSAMFEEMMAADEQ